MEIDLSELQCLLYISALYKGMIYLQNTSYVSDADSPEYGVLSWSFANSGNVTVSPELQNKILPNSGVRNCEDGFKVRT